MLFRGSSITFDAALRDLGSKDPRVRAAAADALGNLPDGEDRAKATVGLVATLKDERFEVRCAAALSLGDLGDLDAVEPLIGRLADDNGEVRQSAAIALGRLGDARAFQPLADALKDGPADLRFQAAPSLVEIDAARAYEPLVAAIADADAEVRASVAGALGAVGDRRATGWIAELLGDPKTRFEAALALAELGDNRAVEPLLEHLDGSEERAYAAIDALEPLADARVAPPLVKIMRKMLGSAVVKARAAAAVYRTSPEHSAEAHAILLKHARARRPDVRGIAEEALHVDR